MNFLSNSCHTFEIAVVLMVWKSHVSFTFSLALEVDTLCCHSLGYRLEIIKETNE